MAKEDFNKSYEHQNGLIGVWNTLVSTAQSTITSAPEIIANFINSLHPQRRRIEPITSEKKKK